MVLLQTFLRHQKPFSANAQGKLLPAQMPLRASANSLESATMVKSFPKSKGLWTDYFLGSWSRFSFGDLEPEPLRVRFFHFKHEAFERKDFPDFKEHLLEHGKTETQTQKSFPPNFHFRILLILGELKF